MREVYETVHEIVDVDGPPEVRASATAKATVAAFAAAEGQAHPRIIELPKTDQGLGFNVMGGKEQNSPSTSPESYQAVLLIAMVASDEEIS